MDLTTDVSLRSWVLSANLESADFPIQNLPFGVFDVRTDSRGPRPGVAVGNQVLDLARSAAEGLLRGAAAEAAAACAGTSLNALMALGRVNRLALRRRLVELLREDGGAREEERARVRTCLVPLSEAELLVPASIGDYTDFYASIFHAANVGRLFRPDNPLLPNYKHVPIGYHGRASSVLASGNDVVRPRGQVRNEKTGVPEFVPSRRLDYELEVGWFVGPGNELGEPIPIAEAEDHIFGLCLVNDWSARDIQTWEYQPLGPFLAKSFATSISPWIVTLEALEPFRVAPARRAPGDPLPLPYLRSVRDQERGAFDIHLEVLVSTDSTRRAEREPARLSLGNLRHMYWTPAQMLSHHASNGCNLRPGDLLASGTVSGPEPDQRGCLLELTEGGTKPVSLPGGEKRLFLEDGDEVILRGWCERAGFRRIGFGECRGRIVPAR
ncbi:MAG: fumarylacetoacetase [Vicinamibacterales bacterium]